MVFLQKLPQEYHLRSISSSFPEIFPAGCPEFVQKFSGISSIACRVISLCSVQTYPGVILKSFLQCFFRNLFHQYSNLWFLQMFLLKFLKVFFQKYLIICFLKILQEYVNEFSGSSYMRMSFITISEFFFLRALSSVLYEFLQKFFQEFSKTILRSFSRSIFRSISRNETCPELSSRSLFTNLQKILQEFQKFLRDYPGVSSAVSPEASTGVSPGESLEVSRVFPGVCPRVLPEIFKGFPDRLSIVSSDIPRRLPSGIPRDSKNLPWRFSWRFSRSFYSRIFFPSRLSRGTFRYCPKFSRQQSSDFSKSFFHKFSKVFFESFFFSSIRNLFNQESIQVSPKVSLRVASGLFPRSFFCFFFSGHFS